MKRMFLTAITLSFALLSFGCGTKVSEVSSVPDEEFTEEEIPTERVRDIVASEDFEYEVLDIGAVITKYIGSDTDVVVPDTLEGVTVAGIGFYAFEAKYDITSVTLPESIISIGEFAFQDCSSLVSVNIPERVTGIERGTFVACTSLEEITIPSAVSYIHEEAFTACESLVSLTINNPDLAYENWGLEDLPNVKIIAPEDSAVYSWASEMGRV